MTYRPWKNECGRRYQHHIKKQNHAKSLEKKTADGLGAKQPTKRHCLSKTEGGGREGGILGVGQLGENSQLDSPELSFPEGSWDCFFYPSSPTMSRWGSWSCTPCLQSCSGARMGCGSAGDGQHVGAGLGNAMNTRPQNMCASKLEDKAENHSNLHSRLFQAIFHSMTLSPPSPTYFPFSSLHIFHIVPSKPLSGPMVYTP